MASGTAHGRVRTTMTTTTTSLNMASILQLIGRPRHAALVYSLHLWYWASMLWSVDSCQTRYPLTSITWPYRRLRFRTHRGRVFFWSWPLPRYWFSIGSQAQARLLLWGRRKGYVQRQNFGANGNKRNSETTHRTITCSQSISCWVSGPRKTNAIFLYG